MKQIPFLAALLVLSFSTSLAQTIGFKGITLGMKFTEAEAIAAQMPWQLTPSDFPHHYEPATSDMLGSVGQDSTGRYYQFGELTLDQLVTVRLFLSPRRLLPLHS